MIADEHLVVDFGTLNALCRGTDHNEHTVQLSIAVTGDSSPQVAVAVECQLADIDGTSHIANDIVGRIALSSSVIHGAADSDLIGLRIRCIHRHPEHNPANQRRSQASWAAQHGPRSCHSQNGCGLHGH